MTTELVSVWSGATERAGTAPGLSSPLIGSSARLCMSLGGNKRIETPVKPEYVPRKVITCWSCRRKFERQTFSQSRQHLKRVCQECRVRLMKPVWK